MKVILILCFLLVQTKGCNSSTNSNQTVDFIEYQAATRGSSFSCKISDSHILVLSQGNETFEKTKKISAEQWDDLSKSIDNLDLEAIPKYKSSSISSASDQSRIAQFVISIDQVLYESEPFDEGNPPEELKLLIDKIIALAESLE